MASRIPTSTWTASDARCTPVWTLGGLADMRTSFAVLPLIIFSASQDARPSTLTTRYRGWSSVAAVHPLGADFGSLQEGRLRRVQCRCCTARVSSWAQVVIDLCDDMGLDRRRVCFRSTGRRPELLPACPNVLLSWRLLCRARPDSPEHVGASPAGCVRLADTATTTG